jgi:hypothetical protein
MKLTQAKLTDGARTIAQSFNTDTISQAAPLLATLTIRDAFIRDCVVADTRQALAGKASRLVSAIDLVETDAIRAQLSATAACLAYVGHAQGLAYEYAATAQEYEAEQAMARLIMYALDREVPPSVLASACLQSDAQLLGHKNAKPLGILPTDIPSAQEERAAIKVKPLTVEVKGPRMLVEYLPLITGGIPRNGVYVLVLSEQSGVESVVHCESWSDALLTALCTEGSLVFVSVNMDDKASADSAKDMNVLDVLAITHDERGTTWKSYLCTDTDCCGEDGESVNGWTL